jgi:hypothetical protein
MSFSLGSFIIHSALRRRLAVRLKKTRQKSIRLPASAADLKFLHWSLQVRNRNFKSKIGTGINELLNAPFISEVRVSGRCDVARISEMGH